MAFPIVFGIINILIIDAILLNTGHNLTTTNFTRGVYMIVQIIGLQVNIAKESQLFLFLFLVCFFQGGGGVWCYNLRWLKIILCSF